MKWLLTILLFISLDAKSQICCVLVQPASPSPDHYVVLTIPSSSVGSTELDSFPVMYYGTYTFMKSTANGGNVTNGSAFDVYFSTDVGGTNVIPFQRVTHNLTTGAVQYAFNAPKLITTGNSVFYLHLGGTGTTDLSNAAATWNQGYYGVYHFEETITGASQTIHDATGFAHNLGTFGTWVSGDQVTGVIGGALTFNAGNGNLVPWTTPSTWSISAWYNTTATGASTAPFGNSTGGQDINNFGAAWHLFNGSSDIIATTSTQTINTWAHVAFTTNVPNAAAYYNGASQATTSSLGQTLTWSIVGGISSGFSTKMIIDEMRLSTVQRGAGWTAAEYLNMNALGTFMTQSGVN